MIASVGVDFVVAHCGRGAGPGIIAWCGKKPRRRNDVGLFIPVWNVTRIGKSRGKNDVLVAQQ